MRRSRVRISAVYRSSRSYREDGSRTHEQNANQKTRQIGRATSAAAGCSDQVLADRLPLSGWTSKRATVQMGTRIQKPGRII